MSSVSVHLVGGGVLELVLDETDLGDVAERLQRERVLVGRDMSGDAGELNGSTVIIPPRAPSAGPLVVTRRPRRGSAREDRSPRSRY